MRNALMSAKAQLQKSAPSVRHFACVPYASAHSEQLPCTTRPSVSRAVLLSWSCICRPLGTLIRMRFIDMLLINSDSIMHIVTCEHSQQSLVYNAAY